MDMEVAIALDQPLNSKISKFRFESSARNIKLDFVLCSCKHSAHTHEKRSDKQSKSLNVLSAQRNSIIQKSTDSEHYVLSYIC